MTSPKRKPSGTLAILVGLVLFVAISPGVTEASAGEPDNTWVGAPPAPGAPEVRYDANMNGYIDREELDGIVSGFFAEHIGREDLAQLLLLQRHRGYIPPPSLLEMRDAAPWYQDGVDNEDEQWGVWRLQALSDQDPVASRLVSRYGWAFDDDMTEEEWRLLYGIENDFKFQRAFVEDIIRVGTLPWMLDESVSRSERDVRWFLTTALAGESRAFAEQILLKDWLLDDATSNESGVVYDLITLNEVTPDIAEYLLGQINRHQFHSKLRSWQTYLRLSITLSRCSKMRGGPSVVLAYQPSCLLKCKLRLSWYCVSHFKSASN